MLLTIDVGNTQTVVGVYDRAGDHAVADGGLVAPWRLSTVCCSRSEVTREPRWR